MWLEGLVEAVGSLWSAHIIAAPVHDVYSNILHSFRIVQELPSAEEAVVEHVVCLKERERYEDGRGGQHLAQLGLFREGLGDRELVPM